MVNRHLCPDCDKVAGRRTFSCVECEPPKWVHWKCGNYTAKEVKVAEDNACENQLRCSNCKEVSVLKMNSLQVVE